MAADVTLGPLFIGAPPPLPGAGVPRPFREIRGIGDPGASYLAARSSEAIQRHQRPPHDQGRRAPLELLNLGLDTSTATGKLMLNVIGAVAQFEREMMLERQREGIAKAKIEGKYRGRAPTARRQTEQARLRY